MRVLAVVQDPAEQRRVVDGLRLLGAEAVAVASAADAHTSLVRDSFDLLVIDGDLDPEGGFSLLYEVREQGDLEGRPTPPAVVLTSRDADRWLADWARADATLPKPVDPFALARVARRLLAELAEGVAAPTGAVGAPPEVGAADR